MVASSEMNLISQASEEKPKKVLVTGILGQDGANMAEYLLSTTNHQVFGMMRRSANPNFINTKNFKDKENFKFVFGDLSDDVSIDNLVKKLQPEYLINFGANSFVGCSWDMPEQVMDVNSLGVLRCLESIRKFKKDCRFYSAGSSEEFGNIDYFPQDMKHPVKPRSPYGVSKATARHLVKVYRESYNMFAVHGILFNHEGTKRGEEFVTRKITKGVAKIKLAISKGKEFKPIALGNLKAKRDWSDSEDFVRGVWLMVNQQKPKDYILASGETHSIAEFVEKAFDSAKIKGDWLEVEGTQTPEGTFIADPLATKYIHEKSGKPLVVIDPSFFRPAEVNLLLGDPRPAMKELKWRRLTSFDKLVEKMVNHDIKESLEEDEQK